MPVVKPVESELRLCMAAVRARLLVCSLQCPWHLHNEHCSVVSRSPPRVRISAVAARTILLHSAHLACTNSQVLTVE